MQFVLSAALILIYTVIGVTDFKRHIIPNSLLICLIFIAAVRILVQKERCALLVKGIVCAVCMIFICIVVHGFCRLLKKPEVFGAGDYKYLIALGYCYGVDGIVWVCAFALAAVLAVYTVSLILRKSLGKIAAAPYFSLGAVIFEIII